MACDCSSNQCVPPAKDSQFRKALWIALVINLAMFLVEIIGGDYAHSSALWADALDFFGDAVNYGISLAVLGLSLIWRSRVAWIKGATLFIFALIVLLKVCLSYVNGIVPEPMMMGVIGVMALVANIVSAVILYAFRDGDANMQSVWLCSRNDAIGNLAVVCAAFGVFGTGSFLPDLLVAVVMAVLGLTAGWKVMRTAKLELRQHSDHLT